ncbi:hypothetical protein [Pseudofulvibacter geojedonensis]|uniref:GLUG domain-containing protein n=1 Tax=Pseudofulvibacter geojedonensis TaxID=1123758 RepID=A0ABW3I116_9FLAO
MMNITRYLTAIICLLTTHLMFSQVGIGTTTPNASAALEIESTDSGILIPRMTQAQRDAITVSAATTGLLIYQTDNTPGFYYYTGTVWSPFGGTDTDWTVVGNDMHNANTGNVGVGNTAPSAKFHVTGSTVVGSAGGLTTLYSNDFSSGTVTSVAGGANTCVGGTSVWHISATSVNASCTTCNGDRAYILYSGTCVQDQTLIEGTFTPTTTSIDISFNYSYNDYIGPDDSLTITLYNETTASVTATLESHAGADALDASHTSTQTVIAGNNYSLRFQYTGDDDLAAAVDDILVQETTTAVTGSYMFRLEDGQQQDGYVLTSDANGNATWKAVGAGGGGGGGINTYWGITGNAGTDGGTATAGGANFIGTTDNQNLDFHTNSIYRGRFSSLGEFFVGTYNTVIPGDLMNAVSNATFDWAVNGYSANDGSGVYGQVNGGNTVFAGVQGEYEGTAYNGPGVRGLTSTTSSAANSYTDMTSAINGQLGNTEDYSAAVYGQTTGNTARRVAGVVGVNSTSGEWGALGYERSNGNDHGVYGSVAYNSGGGRLSTNAINTNIGFGFEGGFLGGFAQGNQYGIIAKGSRFGIYSDGLLLTNDAYAMLNTGNDGNRTVNYTSSSTTIDITSKGVGTLVNGKANINFDKKFKNLINSNKPIIVTVTPMGETKGVYTARITKDGFSVIENLEGNSNVSFSWIAVAEKTGYADHQVPKEITRKGFNENISKIFYNESNNNLEPHALWWNGNTLEFGKTAPDQNIPNRVEAFKRPKDKKEDINIEKIK